MMRVQKLKKRDVKHGIRLTFSVMGKGNKPRDVIAGKATSSFIWKQIEDLQDEDYLFSHQKSHHSRWILAVIYLGYINKFQNNIYIRSMYII